MTARAALEPRGTRLLVCALLATLLLTLTPDRAAGTPARHPVAARQWASAQQWEWPVDASRVDRPFVAPAHRYAPGHRGIDLCESGGASVHAPDAGVVAFSGRVAGRGVLTIDHGDGLVSTLEPVRSDLVAGDPVLRGAAVAVVDGGGHAASGCLHLGARQDGKYVNPLMFLGGIPRAVLLPCC